MALPPKFKGHRMTFTEATTSLSTTNPVLHTLEFYLDYVCPFSAKPEIFKTLNEAVIPHIRANPHLSSNLQLIIRQQIQPWHPSSTLVHEAALAVQRLDPSKFWTFSAALFDDQIAYFDLSVLNETRNETYKRLAKLAADSVGVDEAEVYGLLEVKPAEDPAVKNAGNGVTGDVKAIVKMARLTGVHVTPTVVFDGVVAGEISSSWTGEQWVEWLGKNVV
ncbi:hypothetical protein N657DRAFT_60275 [Parathielavia appendiculata]|uniref:Thioredoxin-like fold domain-containing protein n=1 Tax=Parathielavia appendiculata TaxID=2587402 RepID=A0AAN6UAL5_9PEZI|nr:hypothetical protein N657DRAFT_60275 [Parathielavia appendiculata]